MVTRTTLLSILLSLLLALNAYTAEESKTDKQQTAPADKATELQKEVQDPLSGLILLPIEYSYTGSVGPLQKSSQEMIIEPTFPINISKDWKILTHTLIPIVSLPEIVGEDSSSGLSNIMFSALLAKKTQKVFTWGVGAGLMFPTASNTDPISWTNTPTGYDCWAAGPSVVGVYKKGNWVAGALFNQMWTFSGESNYNVLQIQGLAYYSLGQGYSIGTMPLITKTGPHRQIRTRCFRWA